MTLTIKLDRNWSSFQLANSTPPLSVTGSAIAPSARMHCKARKPNLCATSCDLSQAACVSQRHTNATTRPIKQTPTQDSTAASKWLGAGATTTPQICSTAHSCYPSHIFHCRKHVTITLRGNTYKSSQGTCASNSEMLSSGDHYRSDPVQVQSRCDLSVPNHNQMLCVLHVCLVF